MTKKNKKQEVAIEPGDSDVDARQEIATEETPRDELAELKPLNMDSLQDAVRDDFQLVKEASEAHSVLASRWDVVAKWARLVVALTAALSAVSLVAENAVITTTFSVVTAIIAAMNAAFNPPDTSAMHRLAAKEFHLIARRIELLWRRVEQYGWRSEDGPDEQELKLMYERYLVHRSDIEQATERAPAINRLRKQIRQKKDEYNLSWWGYMRYKRFRKREAKLEQFGRDMELKKRESDREFESKLDQIENRA